MTCDYWDENPIYPIDDWKKQVMDDETRMGYWDWVDSCIEADRDFQEGIDDD